MLLISSGRRWCSVKQRTWGLIHDKEIKSSSILRVNPYNRRTKPLWDTGINTKLV